MSARGISRLSKFCKSVFAKTPHLDAIARNGVRFHYAIVQTPVCVPSRTSMKTSLYAHETGSMAMGKPAEIPGAYTRYFRKNPRNLLDAWNQV